MAASNSAASTATVLGDRLNECTAPLQNRCALNDEIAEHPSENLGVEGVAQVPWATERGRGPLRIWAQPLGTSIALHPLRGYQNARLKPFYSNVAHVFLCIRCKPDNSYVPTDGF